jgi:hypothetical protein
MKRSLTTLEAYAGIPAAFAKTHEPSKRTALFEPPVRRPRHSRATVDAARRAVVDYLATVEVEEDGDGNEVELPRGPALPPGIARALLIVAEAEGRDANGARNFARVLAGIALGALMLLVCACGGAAFTTAPQTSGDDAEPDAPTLANAMPEASTLEASAPAPEAGGQRPEAGASPEGPTVAASDAGPSVDAGPPPQTCDDVAGSAGETVTLYVAGDTSKPWAAYCAPNDAGPPLEYLTLQSPSNNFSSYAAGGASPGTTVLTQWSKIRFVVALQEVDGFDYTYATSSGEVASTPPSSAMPFASAYSCDGKADATASINLAGTGLAVAPGAFVVNGYASSGAAVYSIGNEVVSITGGGFCGGCVPTLSGRFLPLVWSGK